MSWSATVLTLFPEMFPGALGVSLVGKALEKKLWSLEVRDIRDHGIGIPARCLPRIFDEDYRADPAVKYHPALSLA